MHLTWQESTKGAVSELTSILSKHNLTLPEPLVAFRGGGIMEPKTNDLAPRYKAFLSNDRPIAVVPVKEETGGKLTDVIHFPAKKEGGAIRFDANLAAYKYHVGQFVYEHWDRADGQPPLTQVRAVEELPDGRFVTIDRYRPYLRGLGKGAGSLGIHEMDTVRVSLDDTKRLVHVLDSVQPKATEFRSWLEEKHAWVPKEALLHPDNPLTALRGQEWWINPTAKMDRLRELSAKADTMQKEFAALDPAFQPKQALESFIRTNVSIFPHQDGHMDVPGQEKALYIVHGTLYPDNIHQSQNSDRTKTFFTVTGGDRSHIGLAGESIDWLITAAAESPAHQNALIAEFLSLHPGDTDKRGLAMHTLYRALSESSWFASQGKTTEVSNLVKLSYDILQGKGIWNGVNLPLATQASNPLK